jgi:6-phosphogluconolactonase (cycloisomerase 2 family)
VYTAQDFTSLSSLEVIKFPFSTPGPDPIQTQPRPHQIIIDPTEQYLMVSDLGSDRVHIFKINNSNWLERPIVLQQSLCLRPGSTPRHGMFALLGRQTYFFLVNQNINTVITFLVKYQHDGMINFVELAETNLLLRMDGSMMKGGIKASHISISVCKY